jgi:hypothetical protein
MIKIILDHQPTNLAMFIICSLLERTVQILATNLDDTKQYLMTKQQI